MKTHTEYLRCDLTESETTDIAKDLARANRHRSQVEQQKKEVDSQLKAEIEAQNTVISRLSALIEAGYEYRTVECDVVMDTPEKNQKTITRKDTGEIVKVVNMSDEEKQMVLELAEQTQ